jgi:hypothetical protein
MPADYELLDADNSSNSHWYQRGKMYVIVFILFLIMNSQVFITHVIDKFPGATDMNKNPTNKGVIAQCIIFSLLFIALDLLISQNWL